MSRSSWWPPLPIDPFDLAVLEVLRTGQPHDRTEMAALLHTSVRRVRRAVSELRTLNRIRRARRAHASVMFGEAS